MLVNAPGSATLGEIATALAKDGLALCGARADVPGGGLPNDRTVAAWIAEGLPGATDPWLDPVDHTIAGFTARLASGASIGVREAPRRAVGPDLLALFAGTRGK